MWVSTSPAGTILALDYDTLVQRISIFEKYVEEGRLQEWREKVYSPERAQIVFEKNLNVNDRDMLTPYFPSE